MPIAPAGWSRWDPIPENSTQARRVPRGFVVHTFVDGPGPTDLRGYFARADVGAESTWVLPRSGKAIQIMDTNVRVDTQVEGNLWYENGVAFGHCSVECEDDGDPEGHPFTEDQIDHLTAMFVWLHAAHGMPLRWMTHPRDAGFGWHSMWGFADPINLTGGYRTNPWTTSRGKTCPGRTRIGQLVDEVMPRAIEIVSDLEDDMSQYSDQLDRIERRLTRVEDNMLTDRRFQRWLDDGWKRWTSRITKSFPLNGWKLAPKEPTGD